MMRDDDLYAYSLCSLERGWSWRVYDAEGAIVAAGLSPSQVDATAEVTRVMARRAVAPEPAQRWRSTG